MHEHRVFPARFTLKSGFNKVVHILHALALFLYPVATAEKQGSSSESIYHYLLYRDKKKMGEAASNHKLVFSPIKWLSEFRGSRGTEAEKST